MAGKWYVYADYDDDIMTYMLVSISGLTIRFRWVASIKELGSIVHSNMLRHVHCSTEEQEAAKVKRDNSFNLIAEADTCQEVINIVKMEALLCED